MEKNEVHYHGAGLENYDTSMMSTPDKKASPQTPLTKEADVFFGIPVHIIPPGAKFNGRPHKKKIQVSKPKRILPEKAKEKSHSASSRHKPEESPREVADDPVISAGNEVFLAPREFTCPCCRDRNQENLRQLARRSCVRSSPIHYLPPVGYSPPNPSPSPEASILSEQKQEPLERKFVSSPDVEPPSASVLQSITTADAMYNESMNKLAKYGANLSISEQDTKVKQGKMNTPKGDLNSQRM